jgi:hypothetical protein
MPKPNFRVIDNEHEHPLDRARRLISEWRSNAERGQLPIVNVRDSGAPVLDVDHVIRRTQPEHAPKLVTERRRSLWSRLWRR